MSIEEIVDGIKDRGDIAVDPTTAGVDSIVLRESTSTLAHILSIVSGLLINIILILVPIMVVLELCYICFPRLRGTYENIAHRVKTGGIAKRTIEFTFRDAVQAVYEAETKITGKSALWIYFKLKCKSILFIVFMIGLVLMGSDTIINFITNLFQGIINIIRDAAYNVGIF